MTVGASRASWRRIAMEAPLGSPLVRESRAEPPSHVSTQTACHVGVIEWEGPARVR